MKIESKYPLNTWDWCQMSRDDFIAWGTHDGVPCALANRWKKQNGYSDVLDLGTGLGRNARSLARYGFNVHGLDIDQEVLKQAAKFNKNIMFPNAYTSKISYDLGNMTNMPYSDASFDAVFADNIVYLTSYEGMCRTISEIHRVLRPNGETFVKLMKSGASYFADKKLISNNTFECEAQYGTHRVVACCVQYPNLPKIFEGFKILDIEGRLHGCDPAPNEFLILAKKVKSK